MSGLLRLAAVLLIVVSALAAPRDSGTDSRKDVSTPSTSTHTRALDPIIIASPGMAGDVFPAFANHLSSLPLASREWGVVQVKLTNPSTAAPLNARVSLRIVGWSEEEIENVEVGAGESKVLNFAPPLLERAFRNHEIVPGLAHVRAVDGQGRLLFASSIALKMRAAEDMYWGDRFGNAAMIAAWVTPHDRDVEKMLARAKEFTIGHRLPGYEPWKDAAGQEQSTRQQARAIYLALQRHGMSYVKSSTTFGAPAFANVSQRIRTPRESLSNASANCIDGAVMFASMFENLGMEPEIIVVPGHAYVGVRVAQNSTRYLLLDAALVARVPFERAVAIAEKGMMQWNERDVTRVSVSAARQRGIFPMPE